MGKVYRTTNVGRVLKFEKTKFEFFWGQILNEQSSNCYKVTKGLKHILMLLVRKSLCTLSFRAFSTPISK